MGPETAFEAAFSEHVILDGVTVKGGLAFKGVSEGRCGAFAKAPTPLDPDR